MLSMMLIFSAVVLFSYSVVPSIYSKSVALSQKRAKDMAVKMDKVMPRSQLDKLAKLYMIAPLVGGALGFLFMPCDTAFIKAIGVVFGAAFGFIVPSFYTKMQIQKNARKFDDQLVDALMIMSSSFRGGLSLIQAMEAVVEEMEDPISYEFGIVLGENKMGVSLEEALNHLYNRMPSPALQQMTTAILLARETGGNLPAIFQRIVGVIREHKRIKAQIDTLTIQGKIQGAVMSLLPFGFFMMVQSTNPSYFKTMYMSDTGRMFLIVAGFLWVIGGYLIIKISSFKDF